MDVLIELLYEYRQISNWTQYFLEEILFATLPENHIMADSLLFPIKSIVRIPLY